MDASTTETDERGHPVLTDVSKRSLAKKTITAASRRTAWFVASLETRARHAASGRAPARVTDVTVSLTSYPARLQSARLPIWSLLNQSVSPAQVILVLAEDEFPGRRLPVWVDRASNRGLRVMWTPHNTRSYKKLVPLLEGHHGSTIVTADDDAIYPHWWLERLIDAAADSPSAIVGYRATEITFRQDRLAPYVDWPPASLATPTARVFLSGVGGILYPPGSLPPTASDMAVAIRLCPTADDIWFRAMALYHGTEVRPVGDTFADFPVSGRSQRAGALRNLNVAGGANERQFRSVLDHFDLWERLRGNN